MAAAIIQRQTYLISSRSSLFLNPAALTFNPAAPNLNTMISAPRSHGSTAKLLSSPQPAFCDDVISLQFFGLPASSRVKLSCSLVRQEDSIDMKSQAEFVTDPWGCLDPSSSPSLGPSYHGVDPMGIFWSLDSWGKKPYQDMSKIMEPLSYNLTLTGEEGDTILNAVVKRKLANVGVTKIPVHSRGLIGTMFVPPGKGPFPAVLTVHGGRGLKEDCALYLANQGFATLALAFYGLGELPKTYSKINIEYFEEAVDFLEEQAFVVKHSGIGLFGFSKASCWRHNDGGRQ